MNLEIIRKRIRNGFEPFPPVTADFVVARRNRIVALDRQDYATKIDALQIVLIEDIQPKKRK